MDKNHLYLLLRKEKVNEFNAAVAPLKEYNLQNVNLRGRDLSSANLKYADLSGAYLANCNLRAVNLCHAKLEGASMHRTKISGVYFPKNVSAQEIINTVTYGTRIRTSGNADIHENDVLLSEDV
jgi:uncharacterized protein YjbI with pentapeptide repeats